MKIVSRTVLILYVSTLLWLLLFKFSFDVLGVLFDHQMRNLSLIPFVGYSPGNLKEMINNFVVFVPFGLLLGVVFKQSDVRRKLAFIFLVSFAVEIIQFIFAIGTTDATDVILNTLGGLVGLVVYGLASKYIDTKKLDWFIVVVGGVLLVALILVRVLFLRVRY